MSLTKRWQPILRHFPETMHTTMAKEMEAEYAKALKSRECLMVFIHETLPKIKIKYSQENYISPFSGQLK